MTLSAEGNPPYSREDQMRMVVDFMITTDLMQRELNQRSQPVFAGAALFGNPDDMQEFKDVLQSNYQQIGASLQDLGGIALPVRDSQGRTGKLRLIGWNGPSENKPGQHNWQYGPRPEHSLDIDQSYLLRLHSELGEIA